MRPKQRIMYIEYKGENIIGPARIGLVRFSKLLQQKRKTVINNFLTTEHVNLNIFKSC